MRVVLTILFRFSLAAAFLSSRPGHAPNDALTVPMTSGQVHGKVDPALPNVHQFLGISYAVPPVGDLRWTAPQPLNQPDARIEITELPISCVQ